MRLFRMCAAFTVRPPAAESALRAIGPTSMTRLRLNRVPRHAIPAALALAVLTAPVLANEPVPQGAVSVQVDNAKVIRLPEKTQTVVVGNPMIADITLQKNGVVVLTGKSFGITNLIALDGRGAMLAESTISVQAPQASIITVQRGLERESYSCTPNCQPSVQLGDAAKYFTETSQQAEARRGMATANK
jgi:Flp pilus assembly secretin CpaC